MTPPHQPHGQEDEDASHIKSHLDHHNHHDQSPSVESGRDSASETPCGQVTCMDLIDKLTHDLLHFQERFGRTVE
jgi:hypothetical protein